MLTNTLKPLTIAITLALSTLSEDRPHHPSTPSYKKHHTPTTAPTPAPAAASDATATPSTQPDTSVSRTLASIAGTTNAPLKLSSTNAAYTFKIPAAPRETLSPAILHLETTNSTALIRSRSELAIRLNNKILAQFPLDPEKTRNVHDITIPPELLSTGYNDLTISTVQHYSYECEDPASPELWTEIDPVSSFFTFSNPQLLPNPNPSMSQLDLAFDQRAWTPKNIAIVLDPSNPDHISAAALAIQGLAIRAGYQPLHISTFSYNQATSPSTSPHPSSNPAIPHLNTDIAPNSDFLIIGDTPTLSQLIDPSLKQSLSQATAQSSAAIFPILNNAHVALILHAATSPNLLQAAQTLALPSYKFSDAPVVALTSTPPSLLTSFTTNPSNPSPNSYITTPNAPHKLSSFGFSTQTSRGLKVQPISTTFKAPADWGASNGDKATVSLHLAYGAGLRKDSSMTVLINGHRATSIPLTNTDGAEFNNYELQIPAEYIQPGFNSLSFEPVFISHKDKCDMLRDEHLFLTIFEDSTLTLPSPSVPPHSPDLTRTSQSLWPHSTSLNLYPLDTSNATLSSTFTLLSTIAQKLKHPTPITTSFSIPPNAPTLIIGTYSSAIYVQNPSLLPNAPKSSPIPPASSPLAKYNWSAQGQTSAFLQFNLNNQPITAFLATNGQTLLNTAQALHPSTHNLWNQLQGQATIIDTSSMTPTYEYPQPSDLQTTSKAQKIASSLGITQPSTYLLAIAASLALFAIPFLALLRNRRNRRQPTQNTKTPT